MRIHPIDGREYWLPSLLNEFQLQMYVHLIDWKRKYITTDRGKAGDLEYDAILPASLEGQMRVLYSDIIPATQAHVSHLPFRQHKYFNHMASSQAANINLFLPILLHCKANTILRELNPGFNHLATEYLDHGWRIEFWDEPFGILADKTTMSGTDSDIGIAYYNHGGELCLWLIEHKLTESEFTTCGGFKSKGRQERHDCSRNFLDILENKNICYYHDVRKFKYWNITEANREFFINHASHTECPFQGGMNQLWRNQLLALAVQQDERQPYQHAHFSVVRHPQNSHLNKTLMAYQNLTNNNNQFSTFTSAEVVSAAEQHADEKLQQWIAWYRSLYQV